MSTSPGSMSSSSVPSTIPSYCKDYKGHDGTITRLSKENKDIYDKMFSIAGYCPPGKEGCTSQRPRQNGGPPCASWIVYLILCLVPGGHATCDAMLHMARELFPDASIKNQTLRSALCKKPEFYNIHKRQVWRLRNRNEPVPAKRPGGVKPMIERCEGKGTPTINKGKRKAQQDEFDDDDDDDDEMEDDYFPPRSPTEEPVPKKSKVEAPVAKTTTGRKPLPANRCSSVSINSEPLQPILLGPAQDSVETINKPSGYKLTFPCGSVEAWRKNRAQEVENGNQISANDGRPKRTRTMTPKAMEIQNSRKAYKEPNNIAINIKENKKCVADSAETKKLSVAGSKCRVNSHSSKVTSHASETPKLRYKPKSQPLPSVTASRSVQQPLVPTPWKAPTEFPDKFYHLRTQESSGISTPSPPKPAVMWTAWGPRIEVMDTKTNFDYGQELTNCCGYFVIRGSASARNPVITASSCPKCMQSTENKLRAALVQKRFMTPGEGESFIPEDDITANDKKERLQLQKIDHIWYWARVEKQLAPPEQVLYEAAKKSFKWDGYQWVKHQFSQSSILKLLKNGTGIYELL